MTTTLRGIRRSLVALVLTGLAVAAPCTAWYVAGSRAVARDMREALDAPARQARDTAERLAGLLTQRLESLGERENQRPFYHYQNLYHDPRGAYSGTSVIPSPLAREPEDPRVEAHFQIDAAGKVTLPTLNDDVPDLCTDKDLVGQREARAALQPQAAICIAAILDPPEAQDAGGPLRQGESVQSAAVAQGRQQDESFLELQSRLSQQSLAQPAQRFDVDPMVWAQNAEANRHYLDLRGEGKGKGRKGKGQDNADTREANRADSVPDKPSPRPGNKRSLEVSAGAFQWRTIVMGDGPTLVALRQVTTPDSALTQGMLLRHAAIEGWLGSLKGADMPVRL